MARHDTLAAMNGRELLGLWRAGYSKLHQIGLLKGLAPAMVPKICELEAADLHDLLRGLRRQARPRCHATIRLCCVFNGLCWPSTPWRKREVQHSALLHGLAPAIVPSGPSTHGTCCRRGCSGRGPHKLF